MKLSPLYQAILHAVPDLRKIIQFKWQVGRGRVSWVHAVIKGGQTISRFLKKGTIKLHHWISDSEVVSTSRDKLYEVDPDFCSCAEWRHRTSKGKDFRGIKGLNICKHQAMQVLNNLQVENFRLHLLDSLPKEDPEVKLKEKQNYLAKTRKEIEKLLPTFEGITFSHDIKGIGDSYYLVKFKYWRPFCNRLVEHTEILGYIRVNNCFSKIEAKPPKLYLWQEFSNARECLYYLIRNKNLKLEWGKKPEHLQAAEDLFGDDAYSDHYSEETYLADPEEEPTSHSGKWLSLANLK